jgi:RWD domain
MSDDHAEEQAMEAEALAAIFDAQFVVTDDGQWTIAIYPEQGDDPTSLDQLNHVGCRLVVTLPATYPEVAPQLQIDIIKGLTPDEHGVLLQQLAMDEAQANLGVPCIFAVAEVLREWLAAHNQKGLDDQSMHAQMMRKKKQQEEALLVRYLLFVGVMIHTYCKCLVGTM